MRSRRLRGIGGARRSHQDRVRCAPMRKQVRYAPRLQLDLRSSASQFLKGVTPRRHPWKMWRT
eukprot:1709389-Heterocapsa_arctica.AAC.1